MNILLAPANLMHVQLYVNLRNISSKKKSNTRTIFTNFEHDIIMESKRNVISCCKMIRELSSALACDHELKRYFFESNIILAFVVKELYRHRNPIDERHSQTSLKYISMLLQLFYYAVFNSESVDKAHLITCDSATYRISEVIAILTCDFGERSTKRCIH